MLHEIFHLAGNARQGDDGLLASQEDKRRSRTHWVFDGYCSQGDICLAAIIFSCQAPKARQSELEFDPIVLVDTLAQLQRRWNRLPRGIINGWAKTTRSKHKITIG